MATGVNGIATVNDLVTGRGLIPLLGYANNQCPPKSVILSMGGDVPSTYASNQLVKYSDVIKSPVTTTYTLAITTSIAYSSLAFFTTHGGTPSPTAIYMLVASSSPKNYIMTFNQGAGIRVNNPADPLHRVTIHHGSQFRVMGKVSYDAPWTLIATLTHIDGNRNVVI